MFGGEITEETPDMSKIFEMASILNGNNNFEMPDIETIMKISQIMKSINSTENNAGTNLLYSLKPFLRKTKQEKLNQYVNILKISSVISELNKNNLNGKTE